VFFGILFYISLLTFGIDSAFSMSEPMIASINNKWKITKFKATGLICVLGFLLSLVFTTGSGLYWLSILDHFVANFGLVMIGLIECLIIGWFFQISKLRNYANKYSDIIIGSWWDKLIKYIVPLILILLLIFSIIHNIQNPPFEYAAWVMILGGVLPLLIIFLLSFVLMKIKGTSVK
jgi:NSS family neurotransmitter:Na+ symporter